MRPRSTPRIALAAAVLAVVALFGLPGLASRIVMSMLAADGAAERNAYASGSSPWAWRFGKADDVVAGQVFGQGSLEASDRGLAIHARGDGPVQVGFPFSRPTDVGQLGALRLDMSGPSTGRYALLVRQSLEGPLLRAAFVPGAVVSLSTLDWRDEAGRKTSPPSRAAMMRLEASLPPGGTVILSAAGLSAATPPADAPTLAIPTNLSTEALLRWRDRQHAIRPLATFGTTTSSGPAIAWPGWLAAGTYAVLLTAAALRFRKPKPARPHDALLALLGPLWFIAGMGLSAHPDAMGVAMFGGGVAYAAFLTWRRALPPWQVSGSWRMAGWPWLAVPVAIGLVAAAGHPPAWPSAGRILLYVGWAFFQQWLLLTVFGAILARTLPRAMAVLLTALAFALLHTPNGLLMQLCFVAELGWAWWFFQRRAVLPVALAHAASAVVLQAGLAGGILRSLEVSARYLQ